MKITRRKFFKILNIIFLTGFGVFYFDFASKQVERKNPKTKKIFKNDFGNGLHSIDDIVILKSPNEIKVYRANCTHLGCKVRPDGNGNLVCPCHGSKFNFNGEVVNGPAKSSLEELNFKFDKSRNEIIVYV